MRLKPWKGVHVGPRVHISHRVWVRLLQPLVPRMDSLERVLDLCSRLCGAAQMGCDLQPGGGEVTTQQEPSDNTKPSMEGINDKSMRKILKRQLWCGIFI